MMRAARIAAAALFVFCGTVSAQSDGVAEFKGTMGGESGKSIPATGTVYFKKGSAYRTEWDMDLTSLQKERGSSRGMPTRSRMVMIQKLSDLDHMITVNDETKTYSIMDLKKMRESLPDAEHATYTVQKLGRDSVAGFSCEKAIATSSTGSEMELCVSSELFPSAAFLAAQSRRERSGNLLAALQEKGLNGFPIRWTARDKKDRKVVATMELVRLEKKPVPASLFEIPAGYREASGMETMMSPEQQKMMKDALENMTPEQRKMYEEMMKKQGKKE